MSDQPQQIAPRAGGEQPSEVPAAATTRRPTRWRTALLYLAAAVLSLGGVIWVMQLWQADLRAPFNYEGDALFNITIVKVMLDKGWYLHTDALGAPGGMWLEDYPVGDNLVCVLIKAMSLFSSDPVLLTNLFFLATFPLVALSALHAARQFGVSAASALLMSLLYTWLPYHFWRGTVHLYFTAYFLVPPAILIAWWISSGQLLARWNRILFSFGLAVLLGCNMVYYPFFTCFLWVVAAVMAVCRRQTAHALVGGALIAIVFVVVLLNLLPHVLYIHAHGSATSGVRMSAEAELTGLKIAQLLLPVTGHRLPALARLKADYDNTHPLVNENDWVSLGFIGGAGFVALIGWVLFVRLRTPSVPRSAPATDFVPDGFGAVLEPLSVFNLAALLLGTIGGFSTLFAVLVTPQIRAYNRICVFIAFYSLLAVAIGLDRITLRWVFSRMASLICFAALTLLGVVGLLDQTGADAERDWVTLKSLFRNDKQFFAQVQTVLPRGSMIFELPYEPFPEYGSTMYQMVEYAEFRPYVHTHGLRWSYAAIKGRPGDAWERDTAALSPEAMLEALRRAGFAAIYIDRTGYADHAMELESHLTSLLGGGPMSDRMGRFLLYKLQAPVGPPPSLESILPPPEPVWDKGFYALEALPDKSASWRWCAADGELHLLNDSGHIRSVRIDAVLRSGAASASLQIRGGSVIQEDLNITPAGTAFSRVLKLPPGTSVVQFHCDAPPLPRATGDPRSLVWRVDDFVLSNAEPSSYKQEGSD